MRREGQFALHGVAQRVSFATVAEALLNKGLRVANVSRNMGCMNPPSPAANIVLTLDLPQPVARALLRLVRELPADYIDALATDQDELFAMIDAHKAVCEAFIRVGLLAEPAPLASDQQDDDGLPLGQA